MTRGLASIAVALALVAGGSDAVRAQDPAAPAATRFVPDDPELEARVRAVSALLRCPVCQGESIQDSPAELAQQMRAVVREQLQAGRTPDEIKAFFVGRYGEWILLEPAMTGLNLLLYAFPVILLISGVALIVVVVKRWSAASAPAPTD